MEDDDPRPLGGLLESLAGFLDEAAEVQDGGHAVVEQMKVELPIELYIRSDEDGPGGERVAAVDGYTASRTGTTITPVLHRLTLRVEVDGAGEFEPGVEP
jgi:hypothetical protein